MSELVVRAASLGDLERLLDMEQNVISAEQPFNADLKEVGAKYYDIEHLITDNNSCMLVAETNNHIVGSGYARITESKLSLNHQRHSYLGFMFTEPEMRGKGVNKKIVQALIDWSKAQGIQHLYLDVYSNNHAAISAYKKMGFEESLLEMKLCVD